MGISRNLSNLAEGASTTGVLGTSKGGTGLSAVGTNGQVLSSNGTSLTWTTPASGGSVTNVATGTGLTGGPITTTGTISLLTASTTQLGGVKVDGTTIAVNGSGVISAMQTGTVTNIATGTGLTGGPISTTGTISLLTASTTQLGGVKVDGTTITINGSGVISASGSITASVVKSNQSGLVNPTSENTTVTFSAVVPTNCLVLVTGGFTGTDYSTTVLTSVGGGVAYPTNFTSTSLTVNTPYVLGNGYTIYAPFFWQIIEYY